MLQKKKIYAPPYYCIIGMVILNNIIYTFPLKFPFIGKLKINLEMVLGYFISKSDSRNGFRFPINCSPNIIPLSIFSQFIFNYSNKYYLFFRIEIPYPWTMMIPIYVTSIDGRVSREREKSAVNIRGTGISTLYSYKKKHPLKRNWKRK